jgi:hypothetical protein
MVTLNEAARITGISERAIFRGVEASMIHFIESESGALLVCVNSLGSSLCPPW